MVHLNVLGLLYCTHAALPHLLSAAEVSPDRWPTWSMSARWPGCARLNSGVYNATKWGVGAFSESLRQEVTARHVRVTIIEPGATATELASHNRPVILEGMARPSVVSRCCRPRHRQQRALRRDPAPPRGGERDPDPADRAGALSDQAGPVVGSAGSGKTTVATELAEVLGCATLSSMRSSNNRGGPTPIPSSPPPDHPAVRPAWVADGNYSAVRDLVWQQADTVLCLDFPWPVVM